MVDTGPPYPFPPGPQSNQIGTFEIGISPIGTIPPFDWWQTVISQYANSPHLTAIIANFDAWLDQTENFDSFYSNIWNIATATGYGLDVWGRILNISRNIPVVTPIKYFSFDDPSLGFDNSSATVYDNGPLTTEINTALEDSDYRKLLYAKAGANISNGYVYSIMSTMNGFFGSYGSPIFINESNMNNMSYMVCQVGRSMSLIDLSVLSEELLPLRPAGTDAQYYVVSISGPMFGFDIENTFISGFDVGVINMTPDQYTRATI